MSIDGPTFAGMGGETDYTATGDPPIDGVDNVVTFAVSSGGASVAMSEQTDATTFRTTFALTAGDVAITADMTTADGASCSASTQTTVLEYDEIQVKYRAFIPCEAVEGPVNIPWLGLFPFFGGDNRTFSFASPAYRAGFDTMFRVTDHLGAGAPVALPSNGPAFGQTTAYASGSAQVIPGAPPPCTVALNVGATPAQTATLPATSTNHRIELRRRKAYEIDVGFILDASNPITPVDCSINSLLWINLRHVVDQFTGRQTLLYEVLSTSSHDEFPAHELYIRGGAVTANLIQYSPAPQQLSVESLCPGVGPGPVSYNIGMVAGSIETSGPRAP